MSRILGMGYALPSRRVDNRELADRLGVEAAEFAARAGVESRYYAAEGEAPSDLARRAADLALSEAGCSAAEVDLLIFATMTPDVTFPGSACYLQRKLGCRTVGALDVRAQCAGFLFALEIANQFVSSGAYRRVLVAAGDVHSTGLDFSPRGTAVTPLFGDGAAVALVGDGDAGAVESVLHTEPEHFERFWCEFPSSRRFPLRFVADDLERGFHFPRIDADAVRADGRRQIVAAVREVLDRSGAKRDEIGPFFFHHVFPDTAAAAADELGVAERTIVSGRTEGHVASASLAIALSRARQDGGVGPGDRVCLATAGAGANSAATLIQL